MARTFVLRIVEHDVSAVADLLDDWATETCALIWEAGPWTLRVERGEST